MTTLLVYLKTDSGVTHVQTITYHIIASDDEHHLFEGHFCSLYYRIMTLFESL